MSFKDLAEINAFGEKEGLPPIKYKERNCLKCRTKFVSIDNRICVRCNMRNKGQHFADESVYSINYASRKK